MNFGKFFDSRNPTVVFFTAPSCKACKALYPKLEKVKSQFPDVNIIECNVEENLEFSTQYNITALPTLLLFKDGCAKDQIIGAVNEDRLRAFFRNI